MLHNSKQSASPFEMHINKERIVDAIDGLRRTYLGNVINRFIPNIFFESSTSLSLLSEGKQEIQQMLDRLPLTCEDRSLLWERYNEIDGEIQQKLVNLEKPKGGFYSRNTEEET